MKNGSQHPTITPSILPFMFLVDDHGSPIFTSEFLLLPCPFCNKSFALAWDYNLISCKHVNHS
jgi:hypothetical protein